MRDVSEVTLSSKKANNGWAIAVRYTAPLENAPYNQEIETFIGVTFSQAYVMASAFAIQILLDTDEKGVIPLENYDEPDKTPQPEIDTSMTAKETVAALADDDFDIPF